MMPRGVTPPRQPDDAFQPDVFRALDTALAAVWSALETAARDRDAPWRTPLLSTVGADGAPRARVLVLREALRAEAMLRFFTDSRSAKAREIAAAPAVALTFHDSRAAVQLRLEGAAALHRSGAAVDAAWRGLAEAARDNYRTVLAPGSLSADAEALRAGDGRANFAVLDVRIAVIEFLWLGDGGHRRGRFLPRAEGWSGAWLVP